MGGHCLDSLSSSRRRMSACGCVYYPKTLTSQSRTGRSSSSLSGALRGDPCAFNNRGADCSDDRQPRYEIYGDNGYCGTRDGFQLSGHKDEPVADSLEVKTSDYMKSYAMTQVHNIYQAQIAEHAESIRHHKPIDGMQGLHNIALGLACHESATNGGKEVLL